MNIPSLPPLFDFNYWPVISGSANYTPRKHTIMSYAAQNRHAKKRRKLSAKSKKSNH